MDTFRRPSRSVDPFATRGAAEEENLVTHTGPEPMFRRCVRRILTIPGWDSGKSEIGRLND